MKYSASMHNTEGKLDVVMKVGDRINTLEISPKPKGFGSSISGGEILFLAIATCYTNDIYREARNLGIVVNAVEVDVDGDFMGAGMPAENVKCRVKVTAHADDEEIRKLVGHTDTIAEIPMSLRRGTSIMLSEIETISSQ